MLPGGRGFERAGRPRSDRGEPRVFGRRSAASVASRTLTFAGLLDLADLVAVPSRYEGFGLPVLEAMAAGVAVVAADATSLPEVLGDAGRLVPVGAVEAWADAISKLLADDGERRRLGEAGRERAGSFTPQANAAAFAQLYREAAQER